MSNLPPSWSWVKLGDVCTTTSGGTPSRGNSEYYNGTIPWVKSGELDKGLILDTEEKISEEALKNSSAKLFPKGTLLIALYGATIGKLAFLGVEAATNQAVCAIYKNENIDSNFLFNFLFFKKHYLVKQSIGGAQPNISQGILKNLEIPLPPLPEQKKIVEKIEELFSGLDSGIASLKKAKKQIKLYRQSVLSSAFNGKLLNHQEYPTSTVKEELELIDGDRGPNYPKRNDYKVNDYCLFLSTKNVRPTGFLFEDLVFISKEKHNQLRKGTLSRGDLVLTTRGTVGNIAYYDESIPYEVIRVNSGMLILRIRSNNYVPKFIIYYVQSPQFIFQIKQKKTGTAQPQLPANILKSFILPIPSKLVQTQIVEEIEKRFSEADNLEKAIDESLAKSETLRQSILKQAFEGRLV